MGMQKPRILFLDAYDSFSNNIVSLLETTLDVEVFTTKIDDPRIDSLSKVTAVVSAYDAVVCGPGPGHPQNDDDVGAIRNIWRLAERDLVPVLGICLGFQSLCLEFGANIRRLKGPQHGIVRRINHTGETNLRGRKSIFEGVGETNATLYQSLCADIGQDNIPEDSWNSAKWKPTSKCPNLIPLAWVESELTEVDKINCGIADRRVFVGVRHKTKPFWALQYHPESICTNEESQGIIRNWFREARTWSKIYGRRTNYFIRPLETAQKSLLRERDLTDSNIDAHAFENSAREDSFICHTYNMVLPSNLEVSDIVESLQGICNDCILLESSNASNPEAHPGVRGRYSILGLNTNNCQKFEYRVKPSSSDHSATRKIGTRKFWSELVHSLDGYHGVEGNPESPFWGGLIGYSTYELGLEGIDVDLKTRTSSRYSKHRPDACYVFVTESIVVDHQEGMLYFQKLDRRDNEAMVMTELQVTAAKLERGIAKRGLQKSTPELFRVFSNTSKSLAPNTSVGAISVPDNEAYENKVRTCQEYIRNGDSYELCLTDQSIVKATKDSEPSGWSLYKKLRRQQPAPFASYFRMGDVTLVSASPERFLKWDSKGNCELRPMKGTVRKTPDTTFEQAKALLDVPKETAENLMIVDLVRHDLHGICGSGNVTVPKLMVVEEYQSVYQMISIVHGKIPSPIVIKDNDVDYSAKRHVHQQRFTGVDVLAASLPPGSMTGAPKKRSCEILQLIEQGKERSMYSGVVGYMDVGGRGDFSVTIRCMFKWADEDREEIDAVGAKTTIEKWHVGAGGAVTTLSTPKGEREEMLTKSSGTLGVFEALI